jgi:hypothetical protein
MDGSALREVMFSVELSDGIPRKARDIFELHGGARIVDEGDREFRVGADVVAWFTIAGSVASIVSAIVAVATWTSRSGGSGAVELRELPAPGMEGGPRRTAEWSHTDDPNELSDWTNRAEGQMSVRFK